MIYKIDENRWFVSGYASLRGYTYSTCEEAYNALDRVRLTGEVSDEPTKITSKQLKDISYQLKRIADSLEDK